jgi:hypothetical protein
MTTDHEYYMKNRKKILDKIDKEQRHKYYLENKERMLLNAKTWAKNHPEQVKENKRKYREKVRPIIRQTELGTHGETIRGLNKRPYTSYCEICSKQVQNNMAYHHWDDLNLNLGIWVCIKCHYIVEAFELVKSGKFSAVIEKYEQLKAELTPPLPKIIDS